MKREKTNIVVSLIIALIGLAVLFPFFWMIRSSFMSNIEIPQVPAPSLADNLAAG